MVSVASGCAKEDFVKTEDVKSTLPNHVKWWRHRCCECVSNAGDYVDEEGSGRVICVGGL
jgi:hypothetical protein